MQSQLYHSRMRTYTRALRELLGACIAALATKRPFTNPLFSSRTIRSNNMKVTPAILFSTMMVTNAFAETETFDNTKIGSLPSGWIAGVTGHGSPKWAVEADATAPSRPNVLKQSGSGGFPWCVRNDISVT